MLRLFLLRHAKSAWPKNVADRDRPLAERGRQAAPLIGRHMVSAGYRPDFALVSIATRTRQTFALVDQVLKVPRHAVTPAIYGAGAEQLLELMRGLPDDHRAAMLVGHNPGMSDLAVLLTDEMASDDDAMQRLSTKYPTAGLAVFELEAEHWAETMPRSARLKAFVTPRMLGGVDED